jgi:hypothetical protein
VLLFIIDLMATAFQPQGFTDWEFFLIYAALSIVLITLNYFGKRNKLYENLKSYILIVGYIALIYVSFIYFIPAIYSAMYKNLGSDAPYLIVHIFPLIDGLFFGLIILITYWSKPHVGKFIKMFHFLNIGYIVGHLILFSPDEIEFWFLVIYFMMRNFITNWILKKLQKFVIVPSPQPGWLILYLFSLSTNFIPLIGLGKLVVSKSFYS